MIKKFSDIEASLNEMRKIGNPKGELTGFDSLDAIYSIKQGSYTFILAAPHHGKSEFSFELVFNQAYKYGKKTLVYSPETGSVEDIYAEFIHKYTGKQFYKSMNNAATDTEYFNAINYIDEMFTIVDSDDKSYSFEDLTRLVTDEQIILCDPYNEMRHDMSKYGARQDLYIEDLCGEIRRYCKKNKKHCILTLHPSSQQVIEDKKNNLRYYPMPMAREAAGGQALFRKAMTWINLWRPPVALFDEHSHPLGHYLRRVAFGEGVEGKQIDQSGFGLMHSARTNDGGAQSDYPVLESYTEPFVNHRYYNTPVGSFFHISVGGKDKKARRSFLLPVTDDEVTRYVEDMKNHRSLLSDSAVSEIQQVKDNSPPDDNEFLQSRLTKATTPLNS